jgi:hypothetical protein
MSQSLFSGLGGAVAHVQVLCSVHQLRCPCSWSISALGCSAHFGSFRPDSFREDRFSSPSQTCIGPTAYPLVFELWSAANERLYSFSVCLGAPSFCEGLEFL